MPAPADQTVPPRAVVLTGPESTGKTTLAERIARAHDTAWSTEFARAHYAARQRALAGASLGPGDVEPIARGQIAGEEAAAAAAAARGRPTVVRDTDLVSTAVYARHYYGACPPWVEAAAVERRGALYLLCAPDVPWVPDPQRDAPAARGPLLDAFRTALGALAALGSVWVELRGSWPEREAAALAAAEVVRRG